MKKILFISLLAFSLSASAQIATPRFGTATNQDNTGRKLTYGYQAPAFASSYAIVCNKYETIVKMGQLTAAQTLTATVTNCYMGDKLEIIFNSDASSHIVTYSTGFVTAATKSIQANETVVEKFVFNGTGWVRVTNNYNRVATAINATATVTAAQLAGGLLTSTSAAAVTMTLPTATLLATQLGATTGTTFEFVVDNSAGANTVTVAVGAGITASDFPATNTLTRTASTTVGIAVFRITFISPTAAILARVS